MDKNLTIGDIVLMAAPDLYGLWGKIIDIDKSRRIVQYKIQLLNGGSSHEAGWIGDWGPGGILFTSSKADDQEFILEETKWNEFFTKGYADENGGTTR